MHLFIYLFALSEKNYFRTNYIISTSVCIGTNNISNYLLKFYLYNTINVFFTVIFFFIWYQNDWVIVFMCVIKYLIKLKVMEFCYYWFLRKDICSFIFYFSFFNIKIFFLQFFFIIDWNEGLLINSEKLNGGNEMTDDSCSSYYVMKSFFMVE